MIHESMFDTVARTEVWVVDPDEVRAGDELVIGGSAYRLRAVTGGAAGTGHRVARWTTGPRGALPLAANGCYRILPRPGESGSRP